MTSPQPNSNNRLAWGITGIVFLANLLLLSWIGASLITVLGALFFQAVLALAGAALINRYRVRISDPVLFYLAAYCVGLMILYLSGFVWLHRGLLGHTPKWAAIASFAPLCLLAFFGLKQALRGRSQLSPIKTIPLTILLTLSFIVTALATYGFDNNTKKYKSASRNGDK